MNYEHLNPQPQVWKKEIQPSLHYTIIAHLIKINDDVWKENFWNPYNEWHDFLNEYEMTYLTTTKL